MANGIDKLRGKLDKEGLLTSEVERQLEKLGARLDEAGKILDDDTIQGIIVAERDRVELDKKEAVFNFDKILVDWLKESPFFCEISRWVRKRPSDRLPGGSPNPTAAMCYNVETDDIEMLFNKRWFASMAVDEVKGVTRHEFYHLIFRHLTDRRRFPHIVWNLATDLAINSIILSDGGKLPECGYFPGVRPKAPKGREMSKQEKEIHEKFADLIEKMPKMQASDYYFEKIQEWAKKNGYEWGNKGLKVPGMPGNGEPGDGEMDMDGVDSHDAWDDVPEETRGMVEGKLKEIVGKAVKEADKTTSGWGNMPAELREAIRASVSDSVDWKAVLKNFIGMFCRGHRATSIKKINKRYAYIHPGVKRGYLPHIAICIDQSGSVDDTQLEAIFSVLRSLSKKVSFTVIPFDTSVDVKNIYEWKKGATPAAKRTRCGGTDFKQVSDFVNAPENRGKWDGMLICTDGECCDPGTSRVRRGWVITPNHKLLFEIDEMVIQMDAKDGPKDKGSWR